MKTHSFSIVLEDCTHPAEWVANRVFEAGCNDCTPIFQDGQMRLDFDRKAKSCPEAFSSAVKQLRDAGFKPRDAGYVKRHRKRERKAFKLTIMPFGLPKRTISLYFCVYPTWIEVKEAFETYMSDIDIYGNVPCGGQEDYDFLHATCRSVLLKACGDKKIEGFGSEFVPKPTSKPRLGIVAVGDGQVSLERSYLGGQDD